MGTCKISNEGLIDATIIKTVEKQNKESLLPDLTSAEQRSVVTYVARSIHAKKVANSKYSSTDAAKELKVTIDKKLKSVKSVITVLSVQKANPAIAGKLEELKKSEKAMEAMLNSLPDIIKLSRKALVEIKNATTLDISDNIDEDLTVDAASEVEKDRTDYGENFTLQFDAKKKAPGELKAFMSFLKRKVFLSDGTTSDVSNFFGGNEYLKFGEAYSALKYILEDVYPDYASIMERLDAEIEAAKKSGNNSLAWLQSLKDALIEERKNEKSEIINLFIRDMAKHRTKMDYAMVKEIRDREGNLIGVTTVVVSDNGINAHNRTLSTWATNHEFSVVASQVGTSYNKEQVAILAKTFQNLNKNERGVTLSKAEKNANTVNALMLYFSSIGVVVNKAFVNHIIEDNITIYIEGSRVTPAALVNKVKQNISYMHGEVNSTRAIRNTLIQSVARSYSRYRQLDDSSVMRVGDKLIQTYTANHNFANRLRDIKNKGIPGFKETVFLRHSLYGDMAETNPKLFADKVHMKYVSLYPLVKDSNKTRSPIGLDAFTEVDTAVHAIGLAYSQDPEYYETHNFKGKKGQERVKLRTIDGSYVTPKMSDKTRDMTLTGFTFLVADSTSGRMLISPEALSVYVASVVEPEIDRIYESIQEGYEESLNMATYRGDLFYLSPYLNDVFLDSNLQKVAEGTKGSKSLTQVIQEGQYSGKSLAALQAVIEKEVHSYLIAKTEDKVSHWDEIGLENDEGYLKTLTDVASADKAVQVNENEAAPEAELIEIALNMVFSEHISNTNFFQLIAGDPAQYHVEGRVSEEASRKEIDDADVISTLGNITKRLAAEIAPGDEANLEGHPEYLEVFMSDIVSESKNIRDMILILDGQEALDEYDAIKEDPKHTDKELKEFFKELKSADFSKITGTDGQEYITWQTHVNEMYRFGELNKEERDLIFETLSVKYDDNGKVIKESQPLSKALLKKVMGPRKPVHSSTESVALDADAKKRVLRKTYIKSSTFPLLPQLTKNLQLDSLRESLEAAEKTHKMSVRAAYITAAKVGAPVHPLEVLDPETGEFKKELNIVTNGPNSNALVLKTSGLRIQQSVPHSDDKKETKIGSQEKKLLFSRVMYEEFTDPDTGKRVKGRVLKRKYDNIYNELSQEGLREFEEYIVSTKTVNGEEVKYVNKRKLAYIFKQELYSRGETEESAAPLFDALRIDAKTGEFVVPLWSTDFGDTFMALEASIVSKFSLKKKITGTSSVLASEEGFVEWEEGGKDLIENTEGIIFVKSKDGKGFDKKAGLLGQRIGKNGEILPAQIMLPFKFRDSEGKLLNIKDYMQEGTNLLDLKRLPAELLEAFSFRIPTQLQQSMAFVEIVGFIPESLGDMVIATKDFAVTMGSDFDVDKLYSYLYDTSIDENGVLSVPETYTKEERDKAVEELDAEIELIQDKLEKDIGVRLDAHTRKEINSAIKKAWKVKKEELASVKSDGVVDKNTISKEHSDLASEMLSEFSSLKPELIKKFKGEAYDKLRELNAKKDALHDKYKKSLHNSVIKIHKAVMLESTVQDVFLAPLGNGEFLSMADEIDAINNKNKAVPSIISSDYNNLKRQEGNAGGTGISIFSVDSVLQAFLEQARTETGAGVQLVNLPKVPGESVTNFVVKFGTQYTPSTGKLGRTETLKKTSVKNQHTGEVEDIVPKKELPRTGKSIKPLRKKTIADLISALQNISVDNANLRAMAKINLNADTAGVYTLLSMLGFEEDISVNFMSQPIIKEYIKRKAANRGMFADYTADFHEEMVAELTSEFSNEPLNEALADFEGVDASVAMREMIEDPSKNGATQVALLYKFIELDEKAGKLSKVKKYLNLDSKGLNKNAGVIKEMSEGLSSLSKGEVRGALKLLGKFEFSNIGMYKASQLTLAGQDVLRGLETHQLYFKEDFIEGNTLLEFSTVVARVESVMGKTLSEAEKYQLRNEYRQFLSTNLAVEDMAELRNKLFYNTGEGSLFSDLRLLKTSAFAQNNKFLSSISLTGNKTSGLVTINMDRVAGDTFDDTELHSDFLAAMLSQEVITIDGVDIKVSEVMQKLTVYGLMKGGRPGTSFTKYIPTTIRKQLILPIDEVPNQKEFVTQYAINNSDKIPRANNNSFNPFGTEKIVKFGKEIPKFIEPNKEQYPPVVKYRGHLYAKQDKVYVYVDKFNNPDITKYEFKSLSEDVGVSVINDIASVFDNEGITAADFYNNLKGSGVLKKLSPELKAQHAALSNLQGTDAIALRVAEEGELDEGVEASFTLVNGIHTIIVSKDVIAKSDVTLISNIMHEHMHSLTTEKLTQHAKQLLAGIDTSDMPESLQNIMDNSSVIINNLISVDGKVDATKAAALKSYMYWMYMNANVEQLRNTQALTLNKVAYDIYETMIADREAGKTHKSMVAEGLLMNSADMLKVVTVQKEKSFQVATNIYEYMAVVPGDSFALQEGMGDMYKGVMQSIKAFIKDVLKSLGITNEGIINAIADVYDYADVNPANPNTTNKENIYVFHENERMDIDGEDFRGDGTNKVFWGTSVHATITNSYVDTYAELYTKDESLLLTEQEVLGVVATSADLVTLVKALAATRVIINTKGSSPTLETAVTALSKRLNIDTSATSTVPEPQEPGTEDNGGMEDIAPLPEDIKPKEELTEAENLEKEKAAIRNKLANTGSGFGVNFTNNNKTLLTSLERSSFLDTATDLIEKCKGAGAPKAEKGMSFGSKINESGWSVVTKLKGRSHREGGIMLNIGNGTVSKGGKPFKAENGLYVDIKRDAPVTSKGWKIVTKLKGNSHANGGISLNINNGTIKKTGGKAFFKAKNGLLMPERKPESINESGWNVLTKLKGASHTNGGIHLNLSNGNVTKLDDSKEGKPFKAKKGVYVEGNTEDGVDNDPEKEYRNKVSQWYDSRVSPSGAFNFTTEGKMNEDNCIRGVCSAINAAAPGTFSEIYKGNITFSEGAIKDGFTILNKEESENNFMVGDILQYGTPRSNYVKTHDTESSRALKKSMTKETEGDFIPVHSVMLGKEGEDEGGKYFMVLNNGGKKSTRTDKMYLSTLEKRRTEGIPIEVGQQFQQVHGFRTYRYGKERAEELSLKQQIAQEEKRKQEEVYKGNNEFADEYTNGALPFEGVAGMSLSTLKEDVLFDGSMSDSDEVPELVRIYNKNYVTMGRGSNMKKNTFDELVRNQIGVAAQESDYGDSTKYQAKAVIPDGWLQSLRARYGSNKSDWIKELWDNNVNGSADEYPTLKSFRAYTRNELGISNDAKSRSEERVSQEVSKGMWQQKGQSTMGKFMQFSKDGTEQQALSSLALAIDNFHKLKKLYPEASDRKLLDLTSLMHSAPKAAAYKPYTDYFYDKKGNDIAYINSVNAYKNAFTTGSNTEEYAKEDVIIKEPTDKMMLSSYNSGTEVDSAASSYNHVDNYEDAFKAASRSGKEAFTWGKGDKAKTYSTYIPAENPDAVDFTSDIVPTTHIKSKLNIAEKQGMLNIDLNKGKMRFSRSGEAVAGNIILGGDFKDSEPSAASAYEYRNLKSEYTISDSSGTKGTVDETTIYYGVEEGKVKIGGIGEFSDKTVVVPARFNNTYETALSTGQGGLERLTLRGADGKKLYSNVTNGGKVIVYSKSTGNKRFLKGSAKELSVAMSTFKNENPDAAYVLIDNGRFSHTTSNNKGLTSDDYKKYYSGSFRSEKGMGYNLVLGN